jgi:flagellar protein FlaJ
VFPHPLAISISRKFGFIVKFFVNLNPNLRRDLKGIDHKYEAEEYIGVGMVAYSFLGILLGVLTYVLAIKKERPENIALLAGFGIWFLITFVLTYLLTKLPSSELKEKSVQIERYLIYGLKEMVIHANSGASLYEALVNVANGNYGELSKQFDWVVRKVNTGTPLHEALNELTIRTGSDYFTKVVWQLMNTLTTGSDLKSMLQPIIEELDYYQKSQIQNYARELNLWSLVYMIFSAAIPTIGSTMLVVLSVFANFGVDEFFFAGFAGVCLLIQIVLIVVVGKRRPNVIF